ncbi:MAG TPA: hypothetical protein VK947_07210 [Planococcus sp. (in: firmicutes)]|nr:hypothetical protein [Planococcus sp. (in: firmicutes)]
MKVIIPFQGLSNNEAAIDENKRKSSCGPLTASAILKHHEKKVYPINDLYRLLGTTPIGLFTWRLVRRWRRIAGSNYEVKKVRSIEEVKNELMAGRPLALKFDRYFSFQWFAKPLFNYHWVPLIGFNEEKDDLQLYIHDNSKKNRPSKIRAVSYKKHQKLLTFVKFKPLQPKG